MKASSKTLYHVMKWLDTWEAYLTKKFDAEIARVGTEDLRRALLKAINEGAGKL